MSGNKSIKKNKDLIDTNISSIEQILGDINDLTLGVATKDEKDKIKYTGYNDWRLKLEIYSNIDDTTVLNSNLLFDNSNSLEYVDYIHLLANSDEIDVSSNLKFVDYKLLTTADKVDRSYQDDTYQDYIISHKTDKLLLRYTLNILLKKDQVSSITTNFDSINLAQHNYFINYEYQSDNIRDGYTNLTKGWNTIDWFFIYNSNIDCNIALGFNPLLNDTLNTELYSNVELISGILPYNPNGISKNTKSLKYTVSTINNPDDQYIIESQDIPERAYYLTKTYLCNFDSSSHIFYSNITFDMTDLGYFGDARLTLNSITLSNIDSTDLNVKNFSFSNITNGAFKPFTDEQLIKQYESYTFNTDNLNMNFDNLPNFNTAQIVNNNNIYIKTYFDFVPTGVLSLNYNIEFEFYLQIRSLENNTNLVFNQQEAINRKSTNNKIIFMNDGSIGIGTDDSQGYSLYVNNISSSKKGIYCADDITILSDEKYKTNIKTIENPIEKLMALRGVSYNRIDRDINETRLGFIAQEVQKVLPEACDGSNGIKTTDIVALLVEGFKEICKKIDKKT